jgi:pimeloyl-ACP methyl ester carboxylesterase
VDARARIVIDADYRSRVKELFMPTLLVVGRDDSFTGDDSRRMLRELPDGKMAELPGGHLCHMIHPEKFLAAVFKFLGKGKLPRYKAV